MNTYDIAAIIGKSACLEQLAEECAELSKASLKYARILRNENPTPITQKKAILDLIEEIADVRLCIEVIGCFTNLDTDDIENSKLNRWFSRIKEAEIND